MTLSDTPDDAAPRRARRVALPLVAVVLILTVAGAFWVTRFASEVRQDPGLVYRDPGTLDKLLKRARDAEAAGDRATAITTRATPRRPAIARRRSRLTGSWWRSALVGIRRSPATWRRRGRGSSGWGRSASGGRRTRAQTLS